MTNQNYLEQLKVRHILPGYNSKEKTWHKILKYHFFIKGIRQFNSILNSAHNTTSRWDNLLVLAVAAEGCNSTTFEQQEVNTLYKVLFSHLNRRLQYLLNNIYPRTNCTTSHPLPYYECIIFENNLMDATSSEAAIYTRPLDFYL